MKMMVEPPDLDADMRGVIDAARGGYEPNEMARARVRRGVELKVAAGVALAIVTAGVYVAPRYMAKHTSARPPATHVATRPAPVVAPAPPAEIEIPAPMPPAPRAHIKHRAPVAAQAAVPVENV